MDRTSVGVIFRMGVFVACIVGTIFVYQVIATDIANHFAEYATLKAIGYPEKYLSGVVLRQALVLSVLGYVPALLVALVLYALGRRRPTSPGYDLGPSRRRTAAVHRHVLAVRLVGPAKGEDPPTPRNCSDMLIFHRAYRLAWHNLTHDERRLVVSVLGVAFAVFLMFVELGFWNALLDASVELIQQFDGELIVVSKARYALNVKEPFTRRLLEQARSVPGVKPRFPSTSNTPRPSGRTPARSTTDAVSQPHPRDRLRSRSTRADQPRESKPARLLEGTLHRSDSTANPNASTGRSMPGVERELTQQTVHMAGTVHPGHRLHHDGSVVMSDLTFARCFPNPGPGVPTLDMADVGVVKLEPGTRRRGGAAGGRDCPAPRCGRLHEGRVHPTPRRNTGKPRRRSGSFFGSVCAWVSSSARSSAIRSSRQTWPTICPSSPRSRPSAITTAT